MRTVMLDIETSNFKADYGAVLLLCLKPLGEEIVTIRRARDAKADAPDHHLLVRLYDQLDTWCEDGPLCLVSWYGTKFDLRFLRARKVKYRSLRARHPSVYHMDLWATHRKWFGISSNRQATVEAHWGGETTKLQMAPQDWLAAWHGCERSIRKAEERCRGDVTSLEARYREIAPYHGSILRTTL